MLKRTASINIIHRAALAGGEAQIVHSLGLDSKEIKYHDDLIYPAIIQAGVSKIRCWNTEAPMLLAKSELLKNRLIPNKDDSYLKKNNEIRELLFSHSMIEQNHSSAWKVNLLAWFLTDLLYCLDTRSTMIAVLPLPKIQDYEEILSPSILSIVGYLLLKIKSVDLELPFPRFEIESNKVEIFQEVLQSDLFTSYSDSHTVLESSQEDELTAQKNLVDKAASLRKKFVHSIDLTAASLAVIPVTTKLIDTFCSGWPGSLANIFGDKLTALLQENKKIIIYDYGTSHHQMLLKYYQAIKRAKSIQP